MTAARPGLKGKAVVVLAALLILLVQEVIFSKKICFEKQEAGVIKACVLLDFISRRQSDHTCGPSACGAEDPASRHQPASLWNESRHHLDIPLLGDWFPRTLTASGHSVPRLRCISILLKGDPPLMGAAALSPPEPLSGAPPPPPLDNRTSLLRC